jgi:hypothetical protein
MSERDEFTEYRIWFELGKQDRDGTAELEPRVWDRTRNPDHVAEIIAEGKRAWYSPRWGVQEVRVAEDRGPVEWQEG